MKFVYIALALFTMGTAINACSGDKKDGKTTKEEKAPDVPTVNPNGLKIAYYYSDSLRTKFGYFKAEDDRLTKKGEAFQAQLVSRQKALQALEQRFAEDYRAGTAAPDQMAKIEQEIVRKREAFGNFQQTQGAALEKETNESLTAISKKIEAAGKKYCEKYKIDMLLIHGTGGQINFISPSMDVTTSFIDFLNNQEEQLKKDMGEE